MEGKQVTNVPTLIDLKAAYGCVVREGDGGVFSCVRLAWEANQNPDRGRHAGEPCMHLGLFRLTFRQGRLSVMPCDAQNYHVSGSFAIINNAHLQACLQIEMCEQPSCGRHGQQ